jgi:hypothetical protein
MRATRGTFSVFAENSKLIVPLSVPLVPDVIELQLPPWSCSALHGIVPNPVFEMENAAVPAPAPTFTVDGVTVRIFSVARRATWLDASFGFEDASVQTDAGMTTVTMP